MCKFFLLCEPFLLKKNSFLESFKLWYAIIFWSLKNFLKIHYLPVPTTEGKIFAVKLYLV